MLYGKKMRVNNLGVPFLYWRDAKNTDIHLAYEISPS